MPEKRECQRLTTRQKLIAGMMQSLQAARLRERTDERLCEISHIFHMNSGKIHTLIVGVQLRSFEKYGILYYNCDLCREKKL